MTSTLSSLDWFVLTIYACIVIAIGVITGKTEKNTAKGHTSSLTAANMMDHGNPENETAGAP